MLGAPVKTLNGRNCDGCWFLAVQCPRLEGPLAQHLRDVWISLRSQSLDAAIHTNKRQKTKVYIMFSTAHARQQLARCIIFQESMSKGYSLGGLENTCVLMIQSLAQTSRAGHRVRVQVICLTLPLDWPRAKSVSI